MDQLTDKEREELKRLLNRGRVDPTEVGLGWGKFKFHIRGIDLIALIFAFYAIGSLYMYYRFQQENNIMHQKLAEQNEETNFLLTLTPEQRVTLGIQMPESLARKLYKQQGNNYQHQYYYRQQKGEDK